MSVARMPFGAATGSGRLALVAAALVAGLFGAGSLALLWWRTWIVGQTVQFFAAVEVWSPDVLVVGPLYSVVFYGLLAIPGALFVALSSAIAGSAFLVRRRVGVVVYTALSAVALTVAATVPPMSAGGAMTGNAVTASVVAAGWAAAWWFIADQILSAVQSSLKDEHAAPPWCGRGRCAELDAGGIQAVTERY